MNAATGLRLSVRIAAPTKPTYVTAKPFRHFMIDNFFDPAFTNHVREELPKSGHRIARDAVPPIISRTVDQLR
jgi:hypothetical protein